MAVTSEKVNVYNLSNQNLTLQEISLFSLSDNFVPVTETTSECTVCPKKKGNVNLDHFFVVNLVEMTYKLVSRSETVQIK